MAENPRHIASFILPAEKRNLTRQEHTWQVNIVVNGWVRKNTVLEANGTENLVMPNGLRIQSDVLPVRLESDFVHAAPLYIALLHWELILQAGAGILPENLSVGRLENLVQTTPPEQPEDRFRVKLNDRQLEQGKRALRKLLRGYSEEEKEQAFLYYQMYMGKDGAFEEVLTQHEATAEAETGTDVEIFSIPVIALNREAILGGIRRQG